MIQTSEKEHSNAISIAKQLMDSDSDSDSIDVESLIKN